MGRYELLRRLARGGMAELYLARAVGIHGFEKLCVLKLVLPHLAEDRDFADMFLREARIAAGLDHPNIAHVSDIGEIHGEPFFVMQYIHGRDLRAIAKALDGKAMPLAAALTIATSLAAGLHYVHERRGPDGRGLGLVHRDVSPSNVVVGYDGDVKLVDFGIAKSSEQRSATRTGVLKGKVNYMAPEQCHGRPVDRRTDVFALGIMLYEMTTGTRMFAGDNDFYVMTKIVRGVWASPSEVADGYPEALEHIVARAMQVEPEDRYPTVQAIQMDLEAFAQAEGIRISPISLASFMKDTFGEQPMPEAVDPMDVAPTEIRMPFDGPVPYPPDPAATWIGPADPARGHSRVTNMGIAGDRSLRLLRDDTRIGGAERKPRLENTGLIAGELVDEDDEETRTHAKEAEGEGEDATTRIAKREGPRTTENVRRGPPTLVARDGPPSATVVLGTAPPQARVEPTAVLARAEAPEAMAEGTVVAAAPTLEHTAIAPASGELSIAPEASPSGPQMIAQPAAFMPGTPRLAMPVTASGPVASAGTRLSPGWIIVAAIAVGLGTLTAAALSTGDAPAPEEAATPVPSDGAPPADPAPTGAAPSPAAAPSGIVLDPVPRASAGTESSAAPPTEDPAAPAIEAPRPVEAPPEPQGPPAEAPAAGGAPDSGDPPQGARPRRSKRRTGKAGRNRKSEKQRLNDSMYPSG